MLLEVRRRALAALVPPVRLALSDWIEATIRLPSDVSALPGPVRLWPHQRGIADAISDPEIERVTVVKCVRAGYSTLLTSTIASFVANEPSPILALLPTEADARDFVVSDLEPIFEASPVLQGLLSAEGDESGRNTLLSRRFPGGNLKIVAAKAPRNLRRHNARVLVIDEADAMLPGPEGSPVALAEKRTLSFANRKILMGSTPTTEETSIVLKSYDLSDQRVFEVPCPECGHRWELSWRDIQWPPDQPDLAHAVCPECGSVIEERRKSEMVAAGAWRRTRPDVRGHAGFRLSALISTLPNASWRKLAREFMTAKERPDQLQVFVNTVLAEAWREATDEVDEAELAARAEPFGLQAIPAEVLLITCGVDVQHDRLELVFLGHARDATLVLGSSTIWGRWDGDDVWQELDEALRSTWPHPRGGTLRLAATAIDAGDGQTMDRVLSFCQPRFARRIMAVKGASGDRPAIKVSGAKRGRLFIVGVDGLKAQLATRLARGKSVRFSANLEPRFYEEMTSERLVLRYVRGAPVRTWQRIPGRRAESLDCVVYAMAVRHLVSTDFDRLEAELSAAPKAPVPQRVVRSSWMSR